MAVLSWFAQHSKDIQEIMLAAEAIYRDSPMHIMLVTPTLMTRAWCLWELAVRKSAKKFTVPLASSLVKFSVKLRNSDSFFHSMEASVEGDLEVIREKITTVYGSDDAFDWDVRLILKACKFSIQVSF